MKSQRRPQDFDETPDEDEVDDVTGIKRFFIVCAVCYSTRGLKAFFNLSRIKIVPHGVDNAVWLECGRCHTREIVRT